MKEKHLGFSDCNGLMESRLQDSMFYAPGVTLSRSDHGKWGHSAAIHPVDTPGWEPYHFFVFEACPLEFP